eukprot:m51a1_g207 hypothetical protein (273) ;mRNA; r:690932-693817
MPSHRPSPMALLALCPGLSQTTMEWRLAHPPPQLGARAIRVACSSGMCGHPREDQDAGDAAGAVPATAIPAGLCGATLTGIVASAPSLRVLDLGPVPGVLEAIADLFPGCHSAAFHPSVLGELEQLTFSGSQLNCSSLHSIVVRDRPGHKASNVIGDGLSKGIYRALADACMPDDDDDDADADVVPPPSKGSLPPGLAEHDLSTLQLQPPALLPRLEAIGLKIARAERSAVRDFCATILDTCPSLRAVRTNSKTIGCQMRNLRTDLAILGGP